MHFVSILESGQLTELGFWSYALLALLVAVEGPMATLLGAAAASAGLMRPIPVFLAASSGNLAADTLWYLLGYLGKIDWLVRFGRRLGISRKNLARLQKGMYDHAAKVLFLAKLTLSLVIPSLVAAGLVKAPMKRWFPAVFGAEMIWTGLLVVIGYYATEAIQKVGQGLEYVALATTFCFVLFLIWAVKRILHSDSDEDPLSPNSNIEE